MCIENEKVYFTEKARNLGVIFDNKLSMENHLNYLSKILFCELRRIGQMAPFLNETSLKTIMSAFILSRMDYCNSLFVNLSEENLNKLQRFQNRAAKLVFRKRKRDHVSPLLLKLHWLPIKDRVTYKIALLCHKCFNKKAPSYLEDLVNVYRPSRLLQSQNQCLLEIPPKGSAKIADRSFAHAATVI